MGAVDYSQGGEQPVILDLLADLPTGHLLDIGAADGQTLSNSRALLERGWSGVLVEPEPSHFLRLHELYAAREDVRLIHVAIGVGWHLSRFWATPDLVSTTVAAHYEKWRGSAEYTGQYHVAVMPIDHLFVDQEYDFVSVDTEGTSAALALRMLDYGWCPRVLCVEHDGQHELLIKVAANRDYRPVTMNAENLILSR